MEFKLSEIISKNLGGLLNEGRLEDVKAKYHQDAHNSVQWLSERDPSGNNKYLAWLAKQALYTEKELADQYGDDDWYLRRYRGSWKVDVDKLIENITHFHNNTHKYDLKDINQYKTDKQLDDATELAKTKLSRKELKDQGGEKVYEDEDFILIHPKTHEASCKYGSRTRWCVTMRGYTGYFERYSTNGPLFFLMDKRRLEPTRSMRTPDYYKVALHYQPRFDRYGIMHDTGQFVQAARSQSREDFVSAADQGRVTLDHWNVQDKNVAESTILKYLGGPGRGQKARGTEAYTKLKNAMEEYTKKLLGDFWDKVHSGNEGIEEKKTALIEKIRLLDRKRDYYIDLRDQIDNTLYHITQSSQAMIDNLQSDYSLHDVEDLIDVDINLNIPQEKIDDLRDKLSKLGDAIRTLGEERQRLSDEHSALDRSTSHEFSFYDIHKNVPQHN